MENIKNYTQSGSYPRKRVLLGLLPYWTPLIPPLGISYLKSFLNKYGFEAKTVDLNVELKFKKLYDKYFDTLKQYIPENKRGNFYNIGHDLLQNHMTAHIYYEDENEYFDLVKKIIYETYYFNVEDQQVRILNSVLDEFYTLLQEYLVNLLEHEKPEVLGLTVYIHTLPASLFAFRLTKKLYPHIKTVMGGAIFLWQFPVGTPEFEFLVEKTKEYLDTIIVDEGQLLFLKYLQGELEENRRVYTHKDLKGERLSITDAGIPDFSDLKLEFYPYIATFGSKGCPNQCSFCVVSKNFGGYQRKTTKQIVDEIMELYQRNGKRQMFYMIDSLMNPLLTDLTMELARSDVAIYFDGYLRVGDDVCDIENTLLWRRGGFYRARIGTESGSQKILDLIDKKITPDQTRAALVSLAHAGIKTTTFWIIGHPGETEEDFQATLDFVEELKDYIYEAEFNPFSYYYEGQSRADQWKDKSVLLYPGKARDMLISQSWILDCEPSREETYNRLNRFIEHCIRLGIPNPYSAVEIQWADTRWKRLHKNAVPPLMDLMDSLVYIDDRKNVEKITNARNDRVKEATFGF